MLSVLALLVAQTCFAAVTFDDFGLINGVPVFKVTGLADETLTVQRKAADESDWSESTCRLLGTFVWSTTSRFYAFGAADAKIMGSANPAVSFRVSADGGETWSSFTYTPVDTLVGTATTVGYSYSESTTGDKAVDGNPLTWYEPQNGTWPDTTKYFYVDLGAHKRITGVKVVPREGYSGGYCRLEGCVVEVADASDFSKPQRVCVLPRAPNYGIVSVPAETSADGSDVVGRYVRVTCGARTAIYNVAELEVIGEAVEPVSFRVYDTLNRTPIVRAYNLGGAELEAQWKFAGEADFTSCTIRSFGAWNGVSYWGFGAASEKIKPTFTGRVRVVGSAQWTELEMPASTALAGALITSPNFDQGNPASNVLDGNPLNYTEAAYASGKQKDPYAWFGLDLGRRRLVTGCRALIRVADSHYGYRLANRVMQVSDTADFSVISASVALQSAARLAISTRPLAEPVRGRYVRISSNGITDIFNAAEIEFTTSETDDIADAPTLSSSDLTNGYAVVSWATTAPGYTHRDVYVSIAPGGPWTKAARVPVADGCWTNTACTVGVKTYYALANVTGADAAESLTGLSAPVAHYRSCRADRDLSTDTLRAGVTPFGARNIGGYGTSSYPARCFDGDITTYVDAKVNGNGNGAVAIGVDLAEDWVVTGFRYYPRYNSCTDRVGNNYLWGVQHGQSELYASTKLNATATIGSSQVLWREIASGFAALPVRKFFIWNNSLFYGNAGELEVYGYPLSAMAGRLSAPEMPVLKCTANGIRVTWTPCPAATGYELERSTATADWTTVYSGALPTCVDATVTAGEVYTYRVKVQKGSECGYSLDAGIAYAVPEVTVLSDLWEKAEPLGAGVTGAASVDGATGTVTLRTSGGEVDCNGESGYGVWRTEKNGMFTVSCTANVATNVAVNGETCYLIVRGGEGEGQPFAAIGFRFMKSYDGLRFGAVAMRARTAANGTVTETTGWTEPVEKVESVQLQLKVRGTTVYGRWRASSADPWTPLGTAAFPAASAFGERTQTGLLATVPAGVTTVPDAQWTVTDYHRTGMHGLIMSLR